MCPKPLAALSDRNATACVSADLGTDSLGCAHTWQVAQATTQVRHIPKYTLVSINKKAIFSLFKKSF